MKKVLIFGLFLLAFGLIVSPPLSPPAEAFTLAECGSNICATSSNPQVQECCKCHAPCIPSGSSAPAFDPAFLECVIKKEKCPSDCNPQPISSECKVDADCKEKDNDPCTKPMCQQIAIDGICANGGHWGTIIGKCYEVPVPGCRPKNCGTKYPGNQIEQRCCANGYDPAVSKPLWDCCVANLSAIPAKPHNAPCGGDDNCPECPRCSDCPRCPEEGRCPECPKPTPLDCSIFKDAGTKACCEKFKNFPPVMVIDKCVKPGECDNSINIVAEAGATVNLSNFNQCCQYITNPGSIADSTISQICENITTPTPPPPGTPGTTTPAGSPAAQTAAQCSCTPRETMGGTAFAGTPWDCEFQAPASEGPLSLSTAANLNVTTEEPFKVIDSSGNGSKTAALPNTGNKFVVQGPVLTNWHDNPDNAGKVTACTQDVGGSNLACGDCLVATKAQIFGGSGGEGGCSLRR